MKYLIPGWMRLSMFKRTGLLQPCCIATQFFKDRPFKGEYSLNRNFSARDP